MLIETYYDGIEVHRAEKIIYAGFLVPHDVVSTCRVSGGFQRDMGYVYNHQSVEPAGHMHGMHKSAYNDPETYRRITAERHGLPPDRCVTLGTAANMNNAAFVSESFRDLEVVAVCTGGVEGNAGRAGDPASVYETEDGFETLPPADAVPGPGTINIMLFISRPVTPGALTRALVTATEAKTAALQELAVNSLYSDGLATGTGTDQIAAAAARFDYKPLTSAGKHAKLGELIGRAVYKGVKQTLALQNKMTPANQCSSAVHLKRFGVDPLTMTDKVGAYLNEPDAALFARNFLAIERDPVTVAAVAAMVHMKDKLAWGVLPKSCRPEVMGAYAAQIACAVSGKYYRMEEYRSRLAPCGMDEGAEAFLDLVWRAMALGFKEKWIGPDQLNLDAADRKEGA